MLFITKEYNAKTQRFNYAMGNTESARALLNSIKLPGHMMNPITGKKEGATVWKVYDAGQNKNVFIKEAVCFKSENPDVFSMFGGWKWKEVDMVDHELIRPWLEHIHVVIANGDKELAERIEKWIAYPLQNPGKRNDVALFIYCEQGAGKTIFTDMVCDLFSGYSDPDIDNVDLIIGKFNARREGKVIMISDELSSSDSSSNYKKINMDKWKSPITGNTFKAEEKNLPAHDAENVNNFIITSNHADALRLTSGDRRFQVVEASNKYIGDDEYFDKIGNEARTEEVMNHLFTYFMHLDLTGFKKTQLIKTAARQVVVDASRSSYEMFVDEYASELVDGWECKNCYAYYSGYCKDNGFNACANNVFGLKLREFCERKRVRGRDGKLQWQYILNDERKKKYLDEVASAEEANGYQSVIPEDDD